MVWLVAILCIVLLGLAVFARLAPSDVARWHVMPEGLVTEDRMGQAVRVIDGDAERFAKLDRIILATPRTVLLAASEESAMRTYITRSALFGFPDYTTVALQNGQITIFGRLRFGIADLGVNARRIDGWLSQL